MGTAYLAAIAMGRQASGGLALAGAAALLAAADPRVLGEASFQLSFAAMVGLVYIHPRIRDRLLHFFGVREEAGWLVTFALSSVSVSLAATAMVVPLLGYHYGAVSLLTVPATLMAVPLLPLVLTTSMVITVAGVIGDVPGQIASWLAWPGLAYLLWLAQAFGSLPFAAIDTGPWAATWTIAWYVALVAIFWRGIVSAPSWLLGPAILGPSIPPPSTPPVEPARGSTARSHALFVPLSAAAVVLWAAVFGGSASNGKLRVTFLDVGQGDATLIEGPSGIRVLLDGGPDGRSLEREFGRRLPWWSRRIDVVILTHPDADHLSGLTYVLNRRPVRLVLDPQLPSTSDLAGRWRRLLGDGESGETMVIRSVAGTKIQLGNGAFIEFLHPPERRLTGTGSDVDNNSVLSRIEYGRASFLLTGDVFAEAESYLVGSNASLRAKVLKVAHHGSGNSSTQRFLSEVQPDLAIVSVGAGNPFGHPDEDALGRIEQVVGEGGVLRTDWNGSILIETDGKTLHVEIEQAA